MALTRLKSVVGVGIPDTELCNAGVDLLQASSPEFLCTHCLRTYIFGSLAVRSIGRSIVDEEAAFCGAALHDLGLVPAYLGENRFEVDGADAAREFCSKHQVSPERADVVWEAIALHTSSGIASRMAAEIALVHLGAGLDLLGLGLDQVPAQVSQLVAALAPGARVVKVGSVREFRRAHSRPEPRQESRSPFVRGDGLSGQQLR
jgi:HD domain-containing protein